MRKHMGLPRMFNSGQAFTIIVVITLTVLVARGCDFRMPLTATQKAQEKATLSETQARWNEARQDRNQRAGFDLAMYVGFRLAALALVVAAGAGAISTLTLYGWRRAATVSPTGGLYPLIISKLAGQWRVFDANRSPVASAELGNSLVAPGWEMAQLATTAGAQKVQVEQARSYGAQLAQGGATQGVAVEPAQDAAPIMNWPGRVPLGRYLDAQGGASLDRIFLGVTCDAQTGQQAPVSLAMENLVHFAVAGSSGFGKTVFVNSLLYQFVKTGEVDLCIVDLKGELVAWKSADALRWPLATTRQDGSAILTACYDELQTRKAAFESIGGATDLADYNARSNGAGQFRPLVAVLDEGTILLKSDKELVNKATDLVLLGRSFGLWLLIAAQNFKVSSTASELRDQLTTRVQFHAQDKNQARILLGHDRAQGLGKGRAIARLSGYDHDVEMQGPIVSRQEIDALLKGQQGPRNPMPQVADVTPEQAPNSLTDSQREQIVDLSNAGESLTSIVKTVWGSKNGRRMNQVRAILSSDGVTG